jgi:hypothetical protein
VSSSILGWLGAVVSVTVGMGVLGFIYLWLVLSWEERSTRGLGYYGLPPIQRDRFRRRLRWRARLLHPVLALTARVSSPSLARASFRYEGVSGPRENCSPESFRDGQAYVGGPRNVFVATQTKCGTTWMQHVVYEVLSRGNGDIVETGRTLYSISPWLEALRSVPIEAAPLIGAERPSRIIKTHFPVSLCPFDASARYVHVVRHPASCFASCVDFITANLGPFTLAIEEIRA